MESTSTKLETKNMEMEKTSLGHMPSNAHWVFDNSVTDVFPDMLKRSIPQYEVMRRSVYDLGAGFVMPQTYVVDVGCSRGDSLAPFIEQFGNDNRYVGIDNAPSMLEVAKRRFRGEIDNGTLQLFNMELGEQFPVVKSSLTLCVLTLQFVPLVERPRILKSIYDNTVPGGAMILIEKLQGASAEIDERLIHLYHEMKKSNGYSAEEVERKRAALKGVLVPLTGRRNEELLRQAGFTEVDCFWRWMNFAGFVAIKGNQATFN
jgi:tRNA (cmo5U34)-methyltransferase